jgi:4-hydroxy-2-oxoglutarate aldolase
LTEANHNRSSAARLSRNELCGLLLPITTPFFGNGALDLDGLRSNILRWNETGVDGYVLLGSTGERVHLDESEYVHVIVTAREAVPSGHLFIVGAGQQSTLGTINEIKRVAGAIAVDAVLVITPYFYRPSLSQEALMDHYQAVADASPVPVILYSMPALTGIKIESATAARLSEHENIVGLKDSSADIASLQETVQGVRDAFAVLTGNGTVLDAGLRAGAGGAILAVGCVAPSLCLAVMDAVKAGDTDRAAQLQSHLSPLAAAVTTRFGLGGLKTALDMKDWTGGFVRAPLRMPGEEGRDEIRRCLEEADKALAEGSAKQTQIA